MSRFTPRAAALLVVLLVWALYARVIGNAFLHDDALVLFEINNRALATVFAPGGAHYRPSSYAIWLLARDLFGSFEAPVFYWMNLALHTLNTVLVMRIASALRHKRIRPLQTSDCAIGLLFGFFPLTYQVLTWASAMVHLTLTAYTLCSALCLLAPVLRARSASATRIAWAAAGGFMLLAMTSHQYGVIAPVAVALIYGFVAPGRRRAFVALGLCLLAPAYALWLSTMTSQALPSKSALDTLLELSRSDAVPFALQAIAVPFAPILVALGFREPVIETRTAILAACLVLGVCSLFVARRDRRLRLWLFAIAWIVLCCAPLLIMLDSTYIRAGPRLFYLAAVGIAIVWGMCVEGLLRQRYLLVVALCAYCAWSAHFVGVRVVQAAAISAHIKTIGADLRRSPEGHRFVVQNHPSWLMSRGSALPIGGSVVLVMAEEYSQPWTLYWANTGVIRDVRFIRADDFPIQQIDAGDTLANITGDILTAGERKALLKPDTTAYGFAYLRDAIHLRHFATQSTVSTRDVAPALARFDVAPGTATLMSAQAALCGDTAQIELAWANVAGIQTPVGVFAHVYGADGSRHAAQDADLANGWLPLNELSAQSLVTETRYIDLPAGLDATALTLRLGVIHKTTGNPNRTFRSRRQ